MGRDAQALDGLVYDDAAVAWDITDALCRLFGGQRACVLFEQMGRNIVGKQKSAGWPLRHTGIEAMKALQDFNDRADATFDMLRERVEAMPLWNGGNGGAKCPALFSHRA